ncbi:jhamt family protein [Megaselia abdita]
MNQAVLYKRANQVQRHDARMVLREYGNLFQWRLDGGDRIMDIGCGSGDVTIDYLEPLLPSNYEKLVGSDVSLKMVSYASDTYGKTHSKVEFDQLDIGDDCMPKRYLEHFNHITSFYCLHWVQDQRKALRNIYDMLDREGDCLLAFLASNPVFDVYKKLSLTEKWAPYMKDLDRFIAPLQYCENPGEEYEKYMMETGFKSYSVEVRQQIFIYEGTDNLKANVKAVNPFVERLSNKQQAEFLNDYIQTVVDMDLSESCPEDPEDLRFITPYKLVIVYGKK